MTTYCAKIPRFRCGYFRPWPCVPLFGPGGPFSKCTGVVRNSTCLLQLFPNLVCAAMMRQSCENSAFLLWLFPAYVCDTTGVMWKFRIFVAAISSLCVCVYVCAVMRHSHVKIPCFHCGYFRLTCVLLCFLFGPDQAGLEVHIWIVGISESETECVATTQLLQFLGTLKK